MSWEKWYNLVCIYTVYHAKTPLEKLNIPNAKLSEWFDNGISADNAALSILQIAIDTGKVKCTIIKPGEVM